LLDENSALKARIAEKSTLNPADPDDQQYRQLTAEKRALQQAHEKLTGEFQGLQQQHKKLRENYEKIKPEWAEFRQLNPLALKKKLEAKRKEIKTKSESLVLMQKLVAEKDRKIRQHQETVLVLRRQLNSQNKVTEEAEVDYIYTSECGHYRVFPTSYQSSLRPLLETDYNYRILDIRDGTSFVAAVENGSIVCSQPDPVPADVCDFIESFLAAGEDP
jgi:hypothetical protein